MKTLLLFLTIPLTFYLNAQTDSLKKIRISGIQVKLNTVGTKYNESSREKYKEFVKNNALLNRDVTGYMHHPQTNVHNYSSYFALNMIADLKTKSKSPKVEFVFGLNFGESVISSAYYDKTVYDTVGVFVNAANNESITMVYEISNNLYYQLLAKQLLVPMGINVTTNKSRYLWFTAGIEVSPGLMFSQVFSAQYGSSITEIFLRKDSNLKDIRTYTRGEYDMGKWETSNTKLSGLGFVGYATLPLSVNLRPAKKIKFLKHLNLSGSLAPGFYYSKNKYSGTNSGFVMHSAVGLRYHW